MSLAYIRGREFSTENRFDFWQREILRNIDTSCCDPAELIKQCESELAKHNIYFERQWGAFTGSCYKLIVSQEPIKDRRISDWEYVIDYGSLLDFFNEYFGIKGGMRSEIALRHKYRKLKKLEAYNLHEFAWYLIRIAREIIFHQHSQDLFEAGCIRYYSLDLAWNQIAIEFKTCSGRATSFRSIYAA